MTPLEKAHDEMRNAITAAARRIKELSPQHGNDATLATLRRALRNARVAKKLSMRISLPLCAGEHDEGERGSK